MVSNKRMKNAFYIHMLSINNLSSKIRITFKTIFIHLILQIQLQLTRERIMIREPLSTHLIETNITIV
jgi:hypothetical protein